MTSNKRKEKYDISEDEILKKNFKFVRNDLEDSKINYIKPSNEDYEKIMAKKYYDKLYKEYAIVDLSRYETGQIGMRWRVEKEVISGKGENICANKICSEKKGLGTYEVVFNYKEESRSKTTLVKVRVCIDCSEKLNHKKKHKKLE